MIRVLGQLRRQSSRMFAFLEHLGTDPANNVGEWALSKLHGGVLEDNWADQGRPPGHEAPADFVTCVLTWRKQGKNVYEEAARLI